MCMRERERERERERMERVEELRGEAALQQLLACHVSIVLHFWSKGTHDSIDPLFVQLCVDTPQARFFRVEAEKQPEILAAFNVSITPYFIFLKDGETIDRLEGANPSELANKVSKLAGPRTLSMAAAPSSLGMAGGPTTIEAVQQNFKSP
ncbi:hypothetical protein GOP47_0002332 [Adiantum capillus-veneris]|uniref:Thioredoxin domain-containing protein n=1 Tax=Adiantum capillus-veneris TaxID=13818 RepID=A0A9D4VA69_ADICA|nr:hypothetical protein GOP47_0002332 [Adiantum capillus-veneris]